tara:strand:+ start:5214 stop:6578 length:1365 start_codon:yes stop_codon:yes gene_type:complete
MFKWIINKLKSIGVSPDTPSFELRKIRLLTYISITCISTALFYSLLFFFLGETIPAVLDFLLVILFLPSLILNKFKKHTLAKYLLIINTNIAILLVIIVYGQMYRNELFFIISSMLGIIIFKSKKNGIISFLIAMVFFIVSKILLANTPALYPTDENLTFPLSVIGLISVALIAYLLISYIKNETIDYEGKIITAFENLEEKKHYIIDSLNYAANIQKSILGHKGSILKHFKDGFIIFKPKDIVSGDFYWFAEKDDKRIIAASDCTGHGVPAAFMTIMGNDILNEIVYEDNIFEPNKILQQLDLKIIDRLSNEKGLKRQDGMDISILSIDDKNKKIQFAGAKSPLYIVKDNNIKTIKGSNFPIGSHQYKTTKKYSLHEIPYNQNDKFYLLSDGYQDQFGGPKNKKFLKKKLRELILKISSLPMQHQRTKLEEEFASWKRKEDQTDDVLIIGVLI